MIFHPLPVQRARKPRIARDAAWTYPFHVDRVVWGRLNPSAAEVAKRFAKQIEPNEKKTALHCINALYTQHLNCGRLGRPFFKIPLCDVRIAGLTAKH